MLRKSAQPTKFAAAPVTRRHKQCVETFNSYIFRSVLKQVHSHVGMSERAMSVMNSFVSDTFDQIAAEAGRLAGGAR